MRMRHYIYTTLYFFTLSFYLPSSSEFTIMNEAFYYLIDPYMQQKISFEFEP